MNLVAVTVTRAEFLQHVILAGLVMGVGLAAVAFSRFKFETAPMTLRRFSWWYVGLVGLIALLSVGSDVRNVRCPDAPANTCRFNDMTPAMAVIAVGFMLAGLMRARSMYLRR